MEKQSFADIYAAWEKNHDEKQKIDKRISMENVKQTEDPTVNELRRMKVQEELDLHSNTIDEASSAARAFLESSFNKGLRKVRIITGKGLHSPDGISVIRPQILHIVMNSGFVSSFDAHPKAIDGGSGAIIVTLKKKA